MLNKVLEPYYKATGKVVCNNIVRITEAMLACCSTNTSEIIRELCKINGNSFKANEVWLYRFLMNPKLQIDDKMWRKHLGMVFTILVELGLINKGDNVFINVDFTSDVDDFLILFASIVIEGISIPIYFSMRRYPKRKNMIDQKKMESAFIKAMRHGLSKKYKYTIVADRGFGNDRFITNCIDSGFDFVLRVTPNMNVSCDGKTGLLSEVVTENGAHKVKFTNWDKELSVFRNEKDGSVWYLVSNIKSLSHEDAVYIYKDRFKIEKLFQGMKSSGFKIEDSKIKKYDRFKRMLFFSTIAYSLMVLVGRLVDKDMPRLKKNLPTLTDLILAYLVLPKGFSLDSTGRPSAY